MDVDVSMGKDDGSTIAMRRIFPHEINRHTSLDFIIITHLDANCNGFVI